MSQRAKIRRNHAIDIFQAGLSAVRPMAAIENNCILDNDVLTIAAQQYELRRFEQIFVVGAGKAGASMGQALEKILGDRISRGLICVKYGHSLPLSRIQLLEAGHPVPDESGIAAAKEIYELAQAANDKTLVICLISGGGSSLIPYPVEGISLADKQEVTRVLLSCGATIHEINAIRKHLSAIKGGGLAKAVFPATLVTLILSDVIGDDLDSIASGPCVPDRRTFADCLNIIDKYEIKGMVPETIIRHLEAGLAGHVPETPKAGEPFFENSQNVIIAGNFNALEQARKKAEELGYHVLQLSSMLEGDTTDLAINHIAIASDIQQHDIPVKTPACILSGGESTVRIKGQGKGGRNQEFALAAAIRLDGEQGMTVLSAGTDGNDGPTDAAGAVADEMTLSKARKESLIAQSYLADNDSYNFFDKLDDLYKTGPTNTNVMDIRIVLVDPLSD